MEWQLPSTVEKRDWLLLLTTGVITLVWGYLAGFSDDAYTIFSLALTPFVLIGVAGLKLFRDNVPRITAIFVLVAWMSAFGIVNSRASYVSQSAGFPFVDEQLAYIDEMFGLHAGEFLKLTGSYQWLAQASHFIYYNTAQVVFLGFFVLIIKQDYLRFKNTISILTLGCISTTVLAFIFPAIGAFPHYGLTQADAGFLAGKEIGDMHVAHVMALREGALREIPKPGDFEGLVTFPSFHVIYALAGAYALARIPVLGILSALYAAAVAYTTVPIGGHFAIDTFGGIAIWYLLVRYVDRPKHAATGINAGNTALAENAAA
jgi:membrane-associated phospholipid phosphatase